MRFLPRTLTARTVLLLGLALLLAQLASFALILNDRQQLSLARNETPAITRFAVTASDTVAAAPEFRQLVIEDSSQRGARFAITSAPPITDDSRDADLEERVVEALEDAGVADAEVRAGRAVTGGSAPEPDRPLLQLAMRLPDGSWLQGQLGTPPRDPFLILRLAAATLLLYLLVLGAAIWGARSINRPLRLNRWRRAARTMCLAARGEGLSARRDWPRLAHAAGVVAHPRREHGARRGTGSGHRQGRGDGGHVGQHSRPGEDKAGEPTCARSSFQR